MALDDLFIDVEPGTFTNVEPKRVQKHISRPFSRHVQYHDKEDRCLSSRCGSPTYITVDGVHLCMTHALIKLTEMINRLEGIEDEREASTAA